MAKGHFYSSLDLAFGYHQVPSAQESVEKSYFSTTFWHFEYLPMAFVLILAPATFQRLMSRIVVYRLDKDILGYLDDLIIFSVSSAEHVATLQIVHTRLRQAGLICQPTKVPILPALPALARPVCNTRRRRP